MGVMCLVFGDVYLGSNGRVLLPEVPDGGNSHPPKTEFPGSNGFFGARTCLMTKIQEVRENRLLSQGWWQFWSHNDKQPARWETPNVLQLARCGDHDFPWWNCCFLFKDRTIFSIISPCISSSSNLHPSFFRGFNEEWIRHRWFGCTNWWQLCLYGTQPSSSVTQWCDDCGSCLVLRVMSYDFVRKKTIIKQLGILWTTHPGRDISLTICDL